MPTKCNRRVVRETGDTKYELGQTRAVIVEIEQGGGLIRVRLAGLRKRYGITPGALYSFAVRMEVDAEKRAKWLEKQAKKKKQQ